MRRLHYRACHLCEALCGLEVELEEDRVLSIRGDREDPFSRGHLCPKAWGLKDVHEDPDRQRKPLRRVGDRWEELSWEQATELAAEKLVAVQRAHGRNAVAVYQGNPSVHNYGVLLFGQYALGKLGTRNRYSATSVDQLPHMLAALWLFGNQLLLPIPDLDRTEHLLLLGANPLVSNGSLMTAPDVRGRLEALRARGGRLVVVDPRRTQTAEVADEHHFVRPGTDALLLAAMARTLFEEGLWRPGRLGAFTRGIEEVRAAVEPFAPELVAERVGIDAPTIRRLARDFAAARRAVAYGRFGVSTQEFGGVACWLLNVLNVLTGNLDREGGALFTRPAFDVVGLTRGSSARGHFDKGRTRVRGLPEFGGEYPVAALAEEIETPGEGQVRALVTVAGNPVLSTPQGDRLGRALAGLDFMVSVDVFLNETTRHAHLLLPPTFGLEHDHYDVIFHALALRDTARYNPAAVEPSPGARHDWQLFADLALALEKARGARGLRALRARAEHALLRRLGPAGVVDLALRVGPEGLFSTSRRGRPLSLAALAREPHGVDLGPLRPCLPERLQTSDARIALAPPRFLEDLARLRASLAEPAPALVLIGRRELRSNNSWLHNSERFVRGRERCTLLMHPEDARARGLSNGQRVRLRSRVGSVEAPLEVSDEVRPGVVSLPHGWGHASPLVQLRVARAHAGVSVNDVTDAAQVDALSGNAVLNGVPVEVEDAAPAAE